MKRLVFLLVIFAAAPVSAESLKLDGRMVQGGLIVGHADPGATVHFRGRRVRVSPEGVFLIGFSRDAPKTATLDVTYPSGATRRTKLRIQSRDYQIQRIDGLPPRMVTPPKAAWDRIEKDNAAIKRARSKNSPIPYFLAGWIWPTKGRISGVYGSQRILNGKPRQPHYGIDIAAPAGTPVVAPSDGVVVLAETDMYYTGSTLILDHGHGLTSAFLHMRDIDVKVGRHVSKGEKIGAVGSTGRSTGPHLDWRVNLFNTRIDPSLLAPPMQSPAKKPMSRK